MNIDVPSFCRLQEARPITPLVVNVPHAGETIPESAAATIKLPNDVLRRDVDLAVDSLCRNATSVGAALLSTTISRFVVDLNRDPLDYGSAVAVPPSTKPSVSYGNRGLIWTRTTRNEIVVDRPLTPDEVELRLGFYHPYHRILASMLAERRRRFGYALLLDAHSMPSQGAEGHSDRGQIRADFVLGDNLGKACSAELIDPVETVIREAGFSVARNQPYKGGYNTQFYGRPEFGVQALQVEINRKLYMDEDSARCCPVRSPKIRRLMEQVIQAAAAVKSRT
jgi:N-formylglutamate deformylase